ncbi:MAG: hypothetical protein ACRC7N_13505 [Clostridium sp.]
MGMYTELVLSCELKKDVPNEVIKVLEFLTRENELEVELPNHKFFECDRWKWLFTMDSYYFSGVTHCIFRFDDISKTYFLTTRSNLKNYGSEIQKFLNWIYPYIDECEDFLGYYRYEESREPELIYLSELKKEVI